MSQTDHIQTTIQSYDLIASEYRKTRDLSMWQEEFDFFRTLIKGKKVIDIGCGSARDGRLFVDRGFKYTGVDGSTKMLEQARDFVPEAEFLHLRFDQLDQIQNTFDGFWSAAALMHMPKSEFPSILKTMYDLLTPQGVGFITVPEKVNISETIKKKVKLGIYTERIFSYYSQSELASILEQAGFSIVKTHIRPYPEENWLEFFVQKR